MKETKELTEKQQLVKEILKPFLLYIGMMAATGNRNRDVEKICEQISIKYGVTSAKKTLREYLKEHNAGVYHRFIFEINYTHIDVTGIVDFECLYRADLLDKYYVIDDKMEDDNDYPGDNYRCKHYLELELIEEVKEI